MAAANPLMSTSRAAEIATRTVSSTSEKRRHSEIVSSVGTSMYHQSWNRVTRTLYSPGVPVILELAFVTWSSPSRWSVDDSNVRGCNPLGRRHLHRAMCSGTRPTCNTRSVNPPSRVVEVSANVPLPTIQDGPTARIPSVAAQRRRCRSTFAYVNRLAVRAGWGRAEPSRHGAERYTVQELLADARDAAYTCQLSGTPLRSCSPRSTNVRPEPATKSRTVRDTSTSRDRRARRHGRRCVQRCHR